MNNLLKLTRILDQLFVYLEHLCDHFMKLGKFLLKCLWGLHLELIRPMRIPRPKMRLPTSQMWAETLIQSVSGDPNKLAGAVILPYQLARDICQQLTDLSEKCIPRIVNLYNHILLWINWYRGLSGDKFYPYTICNLDIIQIGSELHVPDPS